VGTLSINEGRQTTTSSTVTLTLTASDNEGGTGVAWMFIREWGIGRQGWQMSQRNQRWQPFAPTIEWEMSSEPGIKYISVWFVDAAWNVSSPATTMINLQSAETAISRGQIHQYRHFLPAGQTMSIHLQSRAGDSDLYVWKESNSSQPEWWSHAATNEDYVSFVAPMDGYYLIEVHGYSDAEYELDYSSPSQAEMGQNEENEEKPLPSAPLVANAPEATILSPEPGFRIYLPLASTP